MCPLRDGMSFRGLSSARRDELQGTLFCVTEGVSGGGEITYSSLVVTWGVYGNGAKASGGLEITHFFVGGGVK